MGISDCFNFSIDNFIHRCYTECAKDAHNNPFLFYHDVEPMDLKRNQIIIQQHIQAGIIRAIRKILPISTILKEYLINSVNIMQEPPETVLVGYPGSGTDPNKNINPAAALMNQTIPPINPNTIQVNAFGVPGEIKPISEKKLDAKLEREVMDIIKSDAVKTDKEKIKAIMKLDKIVSSVGPNDLKGGKHVKTESASKHHVEPINNRLTRSDKEIININIDDEVTVEKSANKIVSPTSLSHRPQPKQTRAIKQSGYETSEKMDPNNVDIIEDYGIGSKKNKKK